MAHHQIMTHEPVPAARAPLTEHAARGGGVGSPRSSTTDSAVRGKERMRLSLSPRRPDDASWCTQRPPLPPPARLLLRRAGDTRPRPTPLAQISKDANTEIHLRHDVSMYSVALFALAVRHNVAHRHRRDRGGEGGTALPAAGLQRAAAALQPGSPSPGAFV